MTEWEELRKEFTEKYHQNDHEALMQLLELGDRIDTELEVVTERNWDKKRKLDSILAIFHNQPHQVIQWTRDKSHYSWRYPFTARGGDMLHKILDIILGED